MSTVVHATSTEKVLRGAVRLSAAMVIPWRAGMWEASRQTGREPQHCFPLYNTQVGITYIRHSPMCYRGAVRLSRVAATAGTCCIMESLRMSIFTIQASAHSRTPSDLHLLTRERSSGGACVSTLVLSCARARPCGGVEREYRFPPCVTAFC